MFLGVLNGNNIGKVVAQCPAHSKHSIISDYYYDYKCNQINLSNWLTKDIKFYLSSRN